MSFLMIRARKSGGYTRTLSSEDVALVEIFKYPADVPANNCMGWDLSERTFPDEADPEWRLIPSRFL
jgi:hypothetical protein